MNDDDWERWKKIEKNMNMERDAKMERLAKEALDKYGCVNAPLCPAAAVFVRERNEERERYGLKILDKHKREEPNKLYQFLRDEWNEMDDDYQRAQYERNLLYAYQEKSCSNIFKSFEISYLTCEQKCNIILSFCEWIDENFD